MSTGSRRVSVPGFLTPPPPSSHQVRIRFVISLSILVVVVLLLTDSLFHSDPNEELDTILPPRIESTFAREGIVLEVENVFCERLSEASDAFAVTCAVTVVEVSDVIEIIVQGSVIGGNVEVDELFSRERLVTKLQAEEYAARLLDDLDSTQQVVDCDLRGSFAVIRSGKQFSCLLASRDVMTITVAGNGSGSISGFESPEKPPE